MKFRKLLALMTALFLTTSSSLSALAANWDLGQQGSLYINTSTDYTVTSTDGNGNNITTSSTITVADNVTTNVTLKDVSISSDQTGVDVGSGANVTLNLEGNNSITTTSKDDKAAIHVSDGNLTITSQNNGTLTVENDADYSEDDEYSELNNSAAIGSNANEDMSGNITIDGNATVLAQSQEDGAAIGSGDGGDLSGNITIQGNAKVEASSGDNGAGIGSGEWDYYDYYYDEEANIYYYYDEEGSTITPTILSGNITITDNAQVAAKGGDDGAGIGTGDNSFFSGNITIDSNAKVWAESMDRGAGIGSGENGLMTGSIIIGGIANVTALSDDCSAGIGAGQEGMIDENGQIIIKDQANVLAIGDNEGTGIGSGEDRKMRGTITISGNAKVTAIAGSDGAAIGADDSGDMVGTIKILDNAQITTGINAYDDAYMELNSENARFMAPTVVYETNPDLIGVIGSGDTCEPDTNGMYYIGVNTIINGISGWDVENLRQYMEFSEDLSNLVLVTSPASGNEYLRNCRIIWNDSKDISALVSGDNAPAKLAEDGLKDESLVKGIAAGKILRSCHLSFDKEYNRTFILRFHLGQELAGKTVEIITQQGTQSVTVSASGTAAITTNVLGDFAVIAK